MSKSNIHKIYVVRLIFSESLLVRDADTKEAMIVDLATYTEIEKYMTNLDKAVKYYNTQLHKLFELRIHYKLRAIKYEYIRRIIKARGKFTLSIPYIELEQHESANPNNYHRQGYIFTITPAFLE